LAERDGVNGEARNRSKQILMQLFAQYERCRKKISRRL